MIAAAINAITRASGTAQMRDRLFLLQMPVMFAGRINGINIDIHNVSNDTAMIMHGGPSHISISLAERSILTRIKRLEKIFKCTIRKRQCFAVDSD